MFGQRTGVAQIGQLALRLGKLRGRLPGFHAVGDTAREPPARHGIGAGIGIDRPLQQIDLAIVAAQGDVIRRKLRLQRNPHGRQIVGTGLRIGTTGRDAVAYPPPEVGLVAHLRAQRIGGIEVWLLLSAQRAIVRLAVLRDRRLRPDLREQARAHFGEIGPRQIIAADRHRQRWIIGGEPRFQRIERAIAERGPPGLRRRRIAGRGRRP
jgi:hypothetical protein